MKEFDKPIPQKEEIEIVDQKQYEKHLAIGNISMHKGHKMFEINCTTGDIVEAKYESVNATFVGGVKRKIITNPNCLYIPCLNKKIAKKKFAKWFMEQSIQQYKNATKEKTK